MELMDNIEEPDVDSMEYVIKRSLLSKNKLAIIVKNPNGGTQYCCVECPVRCTDKETLEVHLLVHNKQYRFLCGICGTGLKRKEHLERHTMEHKEMRPHMCNECGKAFKRKEHLNIHLNIHSGERREICTLCNKTFSRKDHLQKHLQTHNKLFLEQNIYPLTDQEMMDIKTEVIDYEDVKPIIVDVIGSEMQLENVYQDNNDSTMESNDSALESSYIEKRPFACDICSKTYKRKDHLKLHKLTHLKKDKVCSECGKAFHKEEQLMYHMNTHLSSYAAYVTDEVEADISFQVLQDQIDNGFSPENGLLVPRVIKHIEKLTGESRPHECPICHRKFKRKQHLKVHAKVHTTKRISVWCSQCKEGFHFNEDFHKHTCTPSAEDKDSDNFGNDQVQNTPQDAKKENKYPQEFVQVAMGNDDEAQYTMIHDERDIPTPQRVYVCKYCSKPFKRKDHYKIHLNIHTGVKSFFCTDCGKGFYRKDHLQKHTQVHNKLKSKPRKAVPGLYPINMLPKKKQIMPEITIHAPSNTKLRVPLQIKVPYQVVMSMDNGEQRAVTIDPQSAGTHEILA